MLAYCTQSDAEAGKDDSQDFTSSKSIMADVTFLEMATEMEKAGGRGFAANLHDPVARQAFRECVQVLADVKDCGISLDVLAAEQGVNIYKAFADHVTARVQGSQPGGFVVNWKRLSEQLNNQISGGTDIAGKESDKNEVDDAIADTVPQIESPRQTADKEGLSGGDAVVCAQVQQNRDTLGFKVGNIVRRTPRIIIEGGFLVAILISILKWMRRKKDAKKVPEKDVDSLVVVCPGCQSQLEVTVDILAGTHIMCECCQTKFTFRQNGNMEILECPQ